MSAETVECLSCGWQGRPHQVWHGKPHQIKDGHCPECGDECHALKDVYPEVDSLEGPEPQP